jgi:tetratricopeptide (TPR) repeat protein
VLLFTLALLVSIPLPTLAQETGGTPTPEPLPKCPVFEGQSKDVRTSYYMGEGIAYLNTNQLSSAEFSFTCIIRVVDPSYLPAYMTRAVVYTREREYARAINDYTKSIDLDGTLVAAYNNRGVIYTAIQKYDEAASDFDKVLALNADYIPGYNNRSVLYAIQGDYDKAIAMLEDAIKRSGIDKILADLQDPKRPADAKPPEYDPVNARAYALLGIIYSAQSLKNYQDYLFLSGNSGDDRIQSAAGALESRFTFEMRLDDGTWMLTADFSPTGAPAVQSSQ